MIRVKQHNTSNTGRFRTFLLLASFVGMLLGSSLLLVSPFTTQTASAAGAPDCTNVFTSLPGWLTTAVANNQATYQQAMNATGVPWQLLAAIHYRETNLSLTEPGNGQGLFQDGYAVASGGTALNGSQFYQEALQAAQYIQNSYALRNSPNPASNVTPRALTPNEQDINLIKNTLYSWNGRAGVYAQHAPQYGYDASTSPYEGSPYVMNMFDCPRANMGIITQDGGGISGTDTRYGAFTLYARLVGNNYWLAMTQAYSWLVNSQQLYNDPNRTSPANQGLLAANTTYYATVSVWNIGSSTWTNSGNNPVLLATDNPSNRTSIFCDASWLRCNRAAALQQSSVAPGTMGTFQFSITTPNTYGTYKENFNLVSEGNAWMNDIGMYYQWTVAPPTYQWQPYSQGLYGDSGLTRQINGSVLSPNTRYYAQVQALNTGNTTWSNFSNPVRLATSGPTDRLSAWCDTSGWISCNRAATMTQSSVPPGQIGTFTFSLVSPNAYSSYKEYFNLVSDGNTWLNDNGLYFSLTTRPPTAQWQYLGQAAYTDNSRSSPINLSQLSNSTRFYITLTALNTGNTTWMNSGSTPVRLATSNPNDRMSPFCDSSWISCNRPAALDQAVVLPGQVGTFGFWMQAPYEINGTTFNEYFTPVVDGSMWMNNIGLYWTTAFQSSTTAWHYVGQGAYSDAAHTQPINLANATRNTTYYLELVARNVGGTTWSRSSSTPTRLGIPGDQNSVFCTANWVSCNRPAALSQNTVAPGQTGTFDFTITTPNSATNAQLHAQPVIDGLNWLDDIGLYWQVTTN